MTRCRLLALVCLIAAGAFLYLQFADRRSTQRAAADAAAAPMADASESHKRAASATPTNSPQATGTDQLVATAATTATARNSRPAPASAVSVPETAESSSLPPKTILENMRTTIRQYGTMFDGNPVGTNPEITGQLQGDNPKQINFLKQDGNRVNANGALVDSWGTPYFFHQISGQETEIRSAGPDRVMYTADDLVTR